MATEFGVELSNIITNRMVEPARRRALSLSQVGGCVRKLWYDKHCPDKSEPLLPKTRLKFLYGDIIEHLVMFLAKVAGYKVTDQQKKVELNGIMGSIDGKLDGRLVDIKSAASRSMAKFEIDNGLAFDDPFGYLPQLSGYAAAEGEAGADFIAIDKQNGDIVVAKNDLIPAVKIRERIDFVKEAVNGDAVPNRPYTDEPDGKSGNRKLGSKCSYCDYKRECWPGLRIAFYANSPRFLTTIVRPPEVQVEKF